MSVKKNATILVTVVLLLIIAGFVYSLYQARRNQAEFARQLTDQSGGRWANPDAIPELRRSIAAYDRRIQRHVQDAARSAAYWRLLGVRLQQRGLHGEALQAFRQAIELTPEDPTIHHFTGISAAITAKSFHLFPGRDMTDRIQHFVLAEDAFLRAIELDDRYLRPRFSLGVLYVFDLNRPAEAIPHLQRILEIARNDIDAMFVLGRAFYMTGQYRAAADLFDRIIVLAGDERTRNNARNNRETVMRRIHG